MEVAGAFGVGVLEQAVVEADLGVEGVLGGDPVQGALDLAAVGGVAALGGGIVGAAELGDVAVGVLDDVGAGDEVGVAEADFLAGGEAEELLGWVFAEVVSLDVEGFGEGDLAFARGGATKNCRMARRVSAG